jgi:hypothetical protein
MNIEENPGFGPIFNGVAAVHLKKTQGLYGSPT